MKNIWPRHVTHQMHRHRPIPAHLATNRRYFVPFGYFFFMLKYRKNTLGREGKIHNFPIDVSRFSSIRRDMKWILLRLLCQHKASTKLFSFPPPPLWICMIPWKSNLNLFQRHTKATRRRKIVILKGFPSQRGKTKDFSGEGKGNYMQRRGVGGGGWDGKFVEPERANRRMLHDGDSCLIVVFWLFLHLAIIASKSCWLIAF